MSTIPGTVVVAAPAAAGAAPEQARQTPIKQSLWPSGACDTHSTQSVAAAAVKHCGSSNPNAFDPVPGTRFPAQSENVLGGLLLRRAIRTRRVNRLGRSRITKISSAIDPERHHAHHASSPDYSLRPGRRCDHTSAGTAGRRPRTRGRRLHDKLSGAGLDRHSARWSSPFRRHTARLRPARKRETRPARAVGALSTLNHRGARRPRPIRCASVGELA